MEPNKVGRPTGYSKEILKLAEQYKDNLPEDEVIHSIEGLSDYIGVARSTIYEWKSQEDKKDFSDILEIILGKQGKSLINNGVSGKFAPTITKVMLTKHGYREGTELTGANGEPLQITLEDKAKIDGALDKII